MKTVKSTHTLEETTFTFNVFSDLNPREVASNLASEMGLIDWTATFSFNQTRLQETFEVWTLTGLMRIRRTR